MVCRLGDRLATSKNHVKVSWGLPSGSEKEDKKKKQEHTREDPEEQQTKPRRTKQNTKRKNTQEHPKSLFVASKNMILLFQKKNVAGIPGRGSQGSVNGFSGKSQRSLGVLGDSQGVLDSAASSRSSRIRRFPNNIFDVRQGSLREINLFFRRPKV